MELFALRYMTRFSCVGPACEDNCCQHWAVLIDKENFDRLRGKMDSPEERAEFNSKMALVAGKPRPDRFALTVLRDDGTCSFLDESRLCSIHTRYGEELLSEVCATYPRRLTRIDKRVELTGAPSCPEVSRMILFEDDALDLVPMVPPEGGFRFVSTTIDYSKSKQPVDANYDAVRGLVARLLRDTRFPVGSRLFFAAFFAGKTRDILVRGRYPFDSEGLQEVGSSLEERENLATLHQTFRRALVDPAFAVSVARALLALPRHLMLPRLAALITEVEAIPDLHALPPLPRELAERLETFSGRLVLHDVLRTAFSKETSFILFFHKTLARAAAFRYLVGSLARSRGIVDGETFDALARSAGYLVPRMLEHNAGVILAVEKELERHGMTIEQAVGLIRL